jgi:hypothetical protein
MMTDLVVNISMDTDKKSKSPKQSKLSQGENPDVSFSPEYPSVDNVPPGGGPTERVENELCDEALQSIATFKKTEHKPSRRESKLRLSAVAESSWTKEHLSLLRRWEQSASLYSRIHGVYAHRYAKRIRWLRFGTGLITTLIGSSGCVSFFVKLSIGEVNWSELIFGLITFLAGLVSSIEGSFEWQKRCNEHEKTSSGYSAILTEILTLISSPKLHSKDCEFWINRLTSHINLLERDAPYINEEKLKEDEETNYQRRNTMWDEV